MTVSSDIKSGIYRGMCVDNLDPLKQGRIRVQVPGLLGPLASGWAFPAWAMEELQIVPSDRLPDPGQGVWVLAEGEYLYWFAVFGPQARPVPEVYDPEISWVLPVMPLTVSVTIAGILSSPTGTPNPDPVVELQGKVGSTWSTLATAFPALDGAFSFAWTRTTETTFRIHFPGTGPFEEIYSDERVPPTPPNTAAIAWTPPAAVWQIAENVTGTLTTSPAASAAVGSTVRLMVRDGTTGPWTQEGTGVVAADTSWTIPWTRTRTGAINMQAVFMGSQAAGYAETAIASSVAVSVPVAVTMALPAGMAFNTPGVVSGTVGTDLYGPPPGTVRFQTRTPSLGTGEGGTWVEAAAITPLSNGTWSFTYTPNIPAADYRAYYPASGVYQQGVSTPYQTKSLALTTTTTMNVPSGLRHGSSASWTGTVKDAQNKNVTSGTVTLYRQRTTGDTTWYSFATATVSNGAWTASGTPTVVGTTNWRADYGGIPGFTASSSAATRSDVGLGTVALNKTGINHDTLHTTWNAISGATSYETLLNGGLTQDTNELGCWRNGLAQMTTHTYQTRAKAQDSAGAWVYGAWSGAISGYTGRPESRKSGSFGYETRPQGTGSYRPSTGWGYVGDKVAQGYYSQTANNYTGVIDYDEGAFQNWVAGNWGWDVVGNLNFTAARVAMYRVSGVGTGGAVGVWWYVTNSYPNGPVPALAGGEARGSLTPGQAAWVDLPYPHWAKHVLLSENIGGSVGTVYSLATYRYNSGEYCQWQGASAGGNVCNLYVECNWNFVTVGYVAPYWN